MNEHDRIRESLKKIRAMKAEAKPNNILQEDVAGLNNQDFQTEKEAFQQAVPAQVEFTNYKNQPDEIAIRGTLKVGGVQGLQFLMTTKNDDGLYLNCTEFQADATAIDTIAKLRAYFDIWYAQSLEKLNN